MNFLRLRRLAPWLLSLAAAGCGGAAGDPAPLADASAGSDAPGAAGLLAPPPPPCSAEGTGRLRVSLGLDPGLAVRSPEVWLLVRCGLGAGFERVLRWDRAATQTIDALGPGPYEVIGSSFVAPWSPSTRVVLADGATAAVSVTLPPGPPVLAHLRSGAGAGGADGAAAVWRASVPLLSGDDAPSAASLDVEARPFVGDPPAEGDAAFVSVTAVARNPCASGQCPPYTLRALEIRTRAGDAPTGLQGYRFGVGGRLAAGESRSVPRPVVVRGAMPDDGHGIELVLYGDVVRAEGDRP